MKRLKLIGAYVLIQSSVIISFKSVEVQFSGASQQLLLDEHYSNLILQLSIFSSLCTGLVAFLSGYFLKIKPKYTFIMYCISGLIFTLFSKMNLNLNISQIISEMTEFLVPYGCIGFGIYKCTEYLEKNQVRPKR